MEDYTELLTKEEKTILCSIITGRKFKEHFKANEKEFSKIQKGFRAKSLTEQFALSIAVSNVDKPFITKFVDALVGTWLEQIQENIEKLEGENLTHGIALATTMLDSVFADNVDLYLKLTGAALDAEARARLFERMDCIRSERVNNVEVAERIKAMEEENHHLSEQIEAAQQAAAAAKEEHEQIIQEIEQKRAALEASLAEAQGRIKELQTAPSAFKSDDAERLAEFDDTDISALPYVNSDEIVSLCGVISDYNGQNWLIRHADLSHNGRYNVFQKSGDAPPYFANRDKIFHEDGPSNTGFYGIWTWSSVTRENDPFKDYTSSRYSIKLDAIEVVIVAEASSLDALTKLLKDGIGCQLHSRRVMFSIYASKGRYIGVLCNTKQLITANGKAAFAENCNVVPVYEFADDDILRLDNGLSFYRNAFAGLPGSLYHLKSSLDIVKNIVLSSISWSAYKTRGIIRTEYRTFKDFLSAIPVDDITPKIAVACRCSKPAAEELLGKYMDEVWKYFDGDSLEDEIVLSAVSASAELQEKTKAILHSDWETENSRLLAEAQEKLDSLNAELSSATARLTEAQETFEKTKAEEERLASMLAEKEKLAEDVENAVSERIQRARSHAADFIADMAFVGGQQVQTKSAETSAVPEASPELVTSPYRSFPALGSFDDLEAHHSWTDVIHTTALELAEAGVAEQHRNGLAAFLCAAYIEKQPILMVGPNAIDIVQSFCASVAGHKHGMLSCEGNYTNRVLTEIGADGEDIVIINNLLASGWINRLPEILSQEGIFYVATHPYAEDIQVEPQSLYGFMLPLFTEPIVDRKATGKYCGGYFADDFHDFSASKGERKIPKALSKFALSPLIKSRIASLEATMHAIYSATTTDDEFLFAVFPIAYASMSMDELTDAIADSQKGITISANLKRELQFVLGELQ